VAKQNLTWHDDRPGLGPGHIVLDGDPAPQKWTQPPQFSAHVCCGQTAGWLKMAFGTEVGFGPSHIVLEGTQLPPRKGNSSPHFLVHVYCGQTAGCIRKPLSMEVGLDPGHVVLDGDPGPGAPSPRKVAQQPPTFRRVGLLSKGHGFCAVVNYI